MLCHGVGANKLYSQTNILVVNLNHIGCHLHVALCLTKVKLNKESFLVFNESRGM